ncbi:MAG: right-handed parallel beta-helix repeat-containing protein [Anaerolineales bacterium]|nr:right-handed parallel beta-helix repeat-containing protein [Anaerolineales bacterium]
MAEKEDFSAQLPNGKMFAFWETQQKYDFEIHVDNNNPHASDQNAGTIERPFKTINAAAQAATPGTRVLIHAGTYRETVQPAIGGLSPEKMISYETYQGEEVIIKASVEVKDFKPSVGWRLFPFEWKGEAGTAEGMRVWEIELDPEDFKGYNPFCAVNIIHDRLFIEYDKTDMTPYLNRRGMVFVDGKPMKQVPLYNQLSQNENAYWVEANGQKVHIRLAGDDDPQGHVIELSNREQCFAPKVPFLPYIRVKGLTLAHAATGAPVPQRGSLSCYRGHHWIIEDCTIDWSNATGIDCGNECWHHPVSEGQIIGNTIIRRNTIKEAGVCGIAGMFVRDMLIEDNIILGTGWQRMELSWEAGGIKVHNAVDTLIRRNVIKECIGCDALWMDVGNENCRVTSNLFLDGIDSREHIFIECSRDAENLIDNNIIWNVEGRYDKRAVPAEPGSSGWYKTTELEVRNGYGIYLEGTDRLRMVNNLIGKCEKAGFFAKVVAFRLWPKRGGTSRENKFFNNLFYQCGEAAIILPNEHNQAQGNAYLKMPPGYLRVMYPEPEMCLDLATWQEFCGFDRNGYVCDMEIDINSADLTMEVVLQGELPEAKADEEVRTDYFGNRDDGKRAAGPIIGLTGRKARFSIDPRKHNATDADIIHGG